MSDIFGAIKKTLPLWADFGLLRSGDDCVVNYLHFYERDGDERAEFRFEVLRGGLLRKRLKFNVLRSSFAGPHRDPDAFSKILIDIRSWYHGINQYAVEGWDANGAPVA